ncbi:DUF4349 domain-containing protein [Halomonas halocynthiae]|uniref:DUF4349 domain-containing protein n=1 Tax=Halomonas halocynthiae TaxID=176290 RepID=UPI00040913BD|nr:DUF4349 domain-containing protein [Halomonas halocynthiae]
MAAWLPCGFYARRLGAAGRSRVLLRRVLLWLLVLMLPVVLAGCDNAATSLQHSPQPPPQRQAESFSGKQLVRQASVQGRAVVKDAGAANASGPDSSSPDSESRIEERRSYTLAFGETDPLVTMYREVQKACQESHDCQIEQGSLNTPRYGNANGHLALRIVREQVDNAEAVRLIAASPELSGIEITRQDRSQQMIDTDARLAQQMVLRERLKELAEQGRGFSERRIQDLLQVERELARVQGEIESMQGRQRHLTRVTDSVAVNVRFEQQRRIEPAQYGVFSPLLRALDRSVALFFESVGQVVLVVVFLTPWVVIGIPALWLLSRLWRPLRCVFASLGSKRRARQREAQQQHENITTEKRS